MNEDRNESRRQHPPAATAAVELPKIIPFESLRVAARRFGLRRAARSIGCEKLARENSFSPSRLSLAPHPTFDGDAIGRERHVRKMLGRWVHPLVVIEFSVDQ